MVRTPVNEPEHEDGYAAKLVKYIPAEVLAAFIPLVALADKISRSKELWIWLTVGIGAVCVLGYSRWQATDVLRGKLEAAHGEQASAEEAWPRFKIDEEYKRLRPRAYYYGLALVAFAAWALGIAAPVRGLIGMDATQAEFVVAAATLTLPLADVTLRHLFEWLAKQASAHPKLAIWHHPGAARP